MESVLTPEKVMKTGRQFWGTYLESLSVEKRLAGISVEERLAGIDVREIIDSLTPEEIVKAIGVRKVVAILMQDKNSAKLIKRAVLESMEIEEIEAYLHKIKRPKTTSSDAEERREAKSIGYPIR